MTKKKSDLRLPPIASNDVRRALVYIFAGILISVISILFHSSLTKLFFTLPDISGWDGATHEAIINVYSKTNFPSTWGWLSNWQGGMPFPILYPPLMYMLGALFTILIGNSLIAYKFFSALILLSLSISVCMSLRFFYEKEPFFNFDSTRRKIDWGIFGTLVIGISVIFALNTGSPGPKSIFLNSMIGQNLSMIFLLPALFSLTSRSKFFAVIGALSWTLIYLGNIHTALSGIAFSFFILIFQKKADIWFYFKRYVFIHCFGILGASFWILPMLGSYTYFSGSVQPTTPDILILLRNVWPHLFIALAGLFISFKYTKDKNRTLFRWFLALFSTAFFTTLLYVFEQVSEVHIPLPIYFHRWFETYFFLMVVPYTYALIFILKNGFKVPIKKDKVKGSIVISAIFLLTLTSYLVDKKDLGVIYTTFDHDNVSSFAKDIAKKPGLTMVVSRPMESGKQTKSLTLDAEIGKYGGQTTFSNLRESSVNGSFLRMARNTLSNLPENWSLVSYYSPNHSPFINPENRALLFEHLGIRRIVMTDDVYPGNQEMIQFSTTSQSHYTISTTTPGYTVATLKDTAPFASIVHGNIALYIGKNGYRERKITDLNYTRFEEMVFENDFNSNFFSVNVGKVDAKELDKLGKNSTFTVITDYGMYEESEIEKYIKDRMSDIDRPHTVFLYNDNSKTFKKLREEFARSTKVVFFEAKNPSYPYDSIVKKIETLSASTTVTEIPLDVITNDNNNLALLLPASSTLSSSITSLVQKPKLVPTKSARAKQSALAAQKAVIKSLEQKETIYSKRDIDWIFIRQSFHPDWIPRIGDQVKNSYPGAPAYTIIPLDKDALESTSTLSLTFDAPTTVLFGHLLTLLTLFGLLGYAIFYTSKSLKPDIK